MKLTAPVSDQGEGAQTGGRALGPVPLRRSRSVPIKGQCKGNGEASNHWIKIEHLLLYARGARSTANQPRDGKGGGGGERANERRLHGAAQWRDAGHLPLDAAKDQKRGEGQRDRERKRLRNFGQEKIRQ